VKNAVRLGGVGLLGLGLLACGGQEVAGEQHQPVMSKLHVRRDGAGKGAEEGSVRQLGPAPNLSDIEVIAVCSAAFYATYAPYDCEDVTGANGTIFNHGGTWLVLITQEMGYRSPGTQTATMGGVSVPEVANQGILNYNNEYIGWYRYWEPTPVQQSGQFIYSARSINTYALFSDWVQVL
jgi:hypothetical protein